MKENKPHRSGEIAFQVHYPWGKKKKVKIPEEQAKLMESAENSWFILSEPPCFYNLPQLFLFLNNVGW